MSRVQCPPSFALVLEFISNMFLLPYEEDLKNEDNLEYKDGLKKGQNLKNDDNFNNKDDIKKEDLKEYQLPVSMLACLAIFLWD